MRRMTVREVMSGAVISVRPDTPFGETAELLYTSSIGAVPVLDSDDRVLGVVSEADLLPKEGHRDDPPGHRRVIARSGRRSLAKAAGQTAADMMTTPVITVGPDVTLVELARIMEAKRLKWLPVVDESSRAIGVVTRSDLLRVFVRPDAELRAEVIEDVLGRVLWLEPSRVDVEVHDGVVTLAGELDTSGDVEVAVRLTGQVDGVVDVVNKLTYEVDEATADLRRERRTWTPGP